MFLFKMNDDLFLPDLEEELQKLREPPYDSIAGIERWREKTDSMLMDMRIKIAIYFLIGFPLLFIGAGFFLWWRGAYWIHATKNLARMRDEAYAIRLRELQAPDQLTTSPVTR
jgi:hypothetical protein